MSAITDFLNLVRNLMAQQDEWVIRILPASLFLFVLSLIVRRRDTVIATAFLTTGIWWLLAVFINIAGYKISLEEVFIVTLIFSAFVIWTAVKMKPPESKPKPPQKPS